MRSLTFAIALTLLVVGSAFAVEKQPVETKLIVYAPVNSEVLVNEKYSPTRIEYNEYTYIWKSVPNSSYAEITVDAKYDGVVYRKNLDLIAGETTTVSFAEKLGEPVHYHNSYGIRGPPYFYPWYCLLHLLVLLLIVCTSLYLIRRWIKKYSCKCGCQTPARPAAGKINSLGS